MEELKPIEVPQDNMESFEKISSNRERLHELEQTGKFVFHGSPHVLEKLEPHQAKTMSKEKSEMVDDGKPAVITSPFADIAVFRSLFNKINIKNNYTSSFSYLNNNLFFSTNSKSLEQAKNCIGYVYIFNKKDFQQYSSMEYRSEKSVKPIEVLEVTFEDLPRNIDTETN